MRLNQVKSSSYKLALACIYISLISGCQFNVPAAGETLCNPSALTTAIRRANSNPDHTLIQLPADCTIELTESNNTTPGGVGQGNNGLPVIASPITIRGRANTAITRAASASEFRIFYVDGLSGGTLILESVAISNGGAQNGGGIFNHEGVVRLGGGSLISGNRAARNGGGIYSWNGIVETTGSGTTFISNNIAGDYGGGIYAIRNSSLTRDVGRNNLILNAVVFEGNVAESEGGGAIYTNADRFFITEATFSGNNAGRNGGALYIGGGYGSAATIENSEFLSNTAHWGGAIYETRRDSGEPSGELAYFNERGNAGTIITGTAFLRNSAEQGGAIYMEGEIYISDSLFEENEAQSEGGAIKIWGSALLDIINSTFSGNTAVQAPAIFNFGQAYISYVTITESEGEAALFSWFSTIEIANVIVANNSGSDCSFHHPPLRVLENNLDSDDSCTNFSLTEDPMLGPLQINGGTTKTHALLFGSPAIDNAAGSCPETDQRGESRPLGSACDLGAFETRILIDLPDGPIVTLPQPDPLTLITATPTPRGSPSITLTLDSNCRNGDSTAYSVVTSFKAGENFLIEARNPSSTWFRIVMPQGGHCWIAGSNGVLLGDYDQLRVIALPTPMPAAPVGPSNLKSSEIVCNANEGYKIYLGWNDNSDNETGFRIYHNGQLIATLGANVTKFTHTVPGNIGQQQSYYVEAYNNVGGTQSNTVTEEGCLY